MVLGSALSKKLCELLGHSSQSSDSGLINGRKSLEMCNLSSTIPDHLIGETSRRLLRSRDATWTHPYALSSFQTQERVTLDAARALQLLNIQDLRARVEALHKQAYDSAQSNRAFARIRKAPSTLANYDVGDFVLVAKRELRGGYKLSLRWQGSQLIVSARCNYVFDVEYILTKVITPVHATLLRFYHDSSLDETVDLLPHIAHQNQGYEVRKLLDLRYDAEARAYYLLVSRICFEEADNTWEPLNILYEDLPQ
jgi:hypothetical protein